MKKRILALAMASAMTLGLLAGCGGGKADTPAPAPAASSAPAAPAEKPADNPAAPASTGGTFKIGGSGPLTGGAAIYGMAAMRGAQIAVEEINAANGPVKFEFQFEDDVHDAETAVNAYNKLLDDGMQIMLGTVTTGPALSVGPLANQDRVYMLTPSASSADVIDGKDNVFQVCFTDPNQGVGSADYIADNMAGAKIAVIYKNDDAYSTGIRDTFVAEGKVKGLDVVYEGTFTEDTQTDFSVQIAACQDAGADLIFLPMYYTPASVIMTQASQKGYKPTYFGVDGMDGILTMENFDTSLAEGVMLLTPFSADADDARTKNFVATYDKLYNEVPNQFAADGYDCVYVIKAALEAAGCTDDMSAAEICEALVAAMPTISVDGLTGAGMTWDTTGAVSKAPMAVVIENGVYVLPKK